MKDGAKYAALLLLVLGLLLGSRYLNAWKQQEYRVASGKPGAGYQAFTNGLLEVCGEGKTSLRMKLVETEGSVENLRLIEKREVDFGLVQQGVRLSDAVRVVAPIYDDVVHLLVRKDSEIECVEDWRGMRVSIGLESSGTRVIAEQLFAHYGISLSELGVQALEPREAVQKMKAGGLDAMLMVTALRAPIIQELLGSNEVAHMPLGGISESGVTVGISSQYLYLQSSVIAEHAFGKHGQMEQAMPEKALAVLTVPSLLVCHKEVPDQAVYTVARSLYANRYTMSQHVPEALKMREPVSLDLYNYPLHEGAEKYYKRRDPSFLVVYAEVIALLLSGGIALVGVVSAVRKWAERRQKNRIDRYYTEINRVLKSLEQGEEVDLDFAEQRLITLKHQAFDELVDEKLTADESFRIFQDLLEQCMREIENRKMRLLL